MCSIILRVYKKTSGNGGLSLYLGKRDYVDHVTKVDSVDGVVKLDPKDFGSRKVFVQLTCAFRYGREDLDVIGLSFRKDIWYEQIQIYPESHQPKLSIMHDTLMKKAGDNAYPFTFDIPNNLPCSVVLQPGPDDKGKACGVDFEVRTYLAMEADNPDEKIEKKDTARLIVRKIQFAPDLAGAGPKAELRKNFMMSDKPIHLEASMARDLFFHGDSIPIKIKVNNETSKTVKNIKISEIRQLTLSICSETVEANGTLDKTLCITPLLSDNKEKRGLALDGRLKDEDTNLASSTILRAGMEKDVLGIMVSYKIKIHLIVAGSGYVYD
uniref:Arrestin-C n=1 Tax=Gadus morhua TaxID=8049 RepID=A0A8C4ZE78_GADMO